MQKIKGKRVLAFYSTQGGHPVLSHRQDWRLTLTATTDGQNILETRTPTEQDLGGSSTEKLRQEDGHKREK